MKKQLKQTLKITIPALCVIPLLAGSMSLFLDNSAKDSDSIIKFEYQGNNKFDIVFSYVNLIRYLDGSMYHGAAGKTQFANTNHNGLSGEYAQFAQNDAELLVTNDNQKSSKNWDLAPNSKTLDANSGYLQKLLQADNQGSASFKISAKPIDSPNPPPDGENLATFPLDPLQYFKHAGQKYFNENWAGNKFIQPTPGMTEEAQKANLDNNFKNQVVSKTISGGHKFEILFQLDAANSRSADAPNTSDKEGWIDQTVGLANFKPFFGTDIFTPDLNLGNIFRFPVWIDQEFDAKNWSNNVNIVKFDVEGSFASVSMSAINIIWIVAAAIVTAGLFSPLIVYAIKKW